MVHSRARATARGAEPLDVSGSRGEGRGGGEGGEDENGLVHGGGVGYGEQKEFGDVRLEGKTQSRSDPVGERGRLRASKSGGVSSSGSGFGNSPKKLSSLGSSRRVTMVDADEVVLLLLSEVL